ncbi:MAG: GAF domain-containing protein [Oceanospirillaceae bacterium]|nr:GAF domain-containing protein [Oceanospirillaceae bacterium]
MSNSALPTLLSINQRLLKAADIKELSFIIANDTWQIIKYRQACVFLPDRLGRSKLLAVTGLTSPKEATPYSLWLERVRQQLSTQLKTKQPFAVSPAMVTPELAKSWSEWWPQHVVCVPIIDFDGSIIGSVFIVKESPWSDLELQLLTVLMEQWSYCSQALMRRKKARSWLSVLLSKKLLILVLLLVVALGFVPVRLSSMAEAEIVSLSSEVVSVPMNGVVKEFYVDPNESVVAEAPLFALDDTELLNQRAVTAQALAVAEAEIKRTEQQAFASQERKAELAALRGKVREKELNLDYVEESINRLIVRAPKGGVFTYSDPNEWIGKPVVTGERVGDLAQPSDLGVRLWLPVNDAINLELGAEIKIFLQIDPLNAIEAQLTQTSYHATQSPDGVASYQLRGDLTTPGAARIGLRGVAKVFGETKPLAYWIFRRPLGSLRQWLGF